MDTKFQVFFRSPRFKIVEGEEDWTNPGCFGKELAEWLCGKFKERGYCESEVIPEDWGWCVMCSRESCMRWVGCGSMLDSKQFNAMQSPSGEEVIWTAFPVAEIPFYDVLGQFRRLFGNIRLHQLQKDLNDELIQILNGSDFINFCDSP